MENTIRLKEKVWDIYDFTEKDVQIFEHHNSQHIPQYIPPSTLQKDREYVTLYLRPVASSKLYQREEYDLLTYFGEMGGLIEFFVFFGWIITHFFVSRLLLADLVKQVYRV